MEPKTINHFWAFRDLPKNEGGKAPARELTLDGVIAQESWFEDEVTPALFQKELRAGTGDIVVRINSPGGDCVAAAQIYDMLREYAKASGTVTVYVYGIAASAASVIAMAGDTVEMSPLALMMIHNPWTYAGGDREDMRAAMQLLDEVTESIINAYEAKTKLSRSRLANLMDAETWMSSGKAVELGFADRVHTWGEDDAGDGPPIGADGKPSAMAWEMKTTAGGALMKAMARVRAGKLPEKSVADENAIRLQAAKLRALQLSLTD